MDWIELLRLWGPSAIPGVALLIVLRWVGERVDKWSDNAVKLAVALDGLSNMVRELKDMIRDHGKDR